MIVGDGPEKTHFENLSKELGLNRVRFEGFKNPKEYYERASILILASEFEGFGLVIVEGMSFGVVPIVLGSYTAVYDILTSEKDGVIIPYTKSDGFKADVMALKISDLMENQEKLNRMAHTAIENSSKYSINKIYEQWIELINNLLIQ